MLGGQLWFGYLSQYYWYTSFNLKIIMTSLLEVTYLMPKMLSCNNSLSILLFIKSKYDNPIHPIEKDKKLGRLKSLLPHLFVCGGITSYNINGLCNCFPRKQEYLSCTEKIRSSNQTGNIYNKYGSIFFTQRG